MFIFSLVFVFLTVCLTVYGLLPLLFGYYRHIQVKKVEQATKKLDDMYVDIQRKKLLFLFVIVPIIFFVAALVIFNNILAAIGAGVAGLILPNLLISFLEKKRKSMIEEQLIEGLVVLAGCLKAGLSLLQSFEVVIEDVPAPLSQEFAVVVKEVRIGMSMENSLQRWSARLNSRSVDLIVNSITVAQISGGDLTKVFSRLVTTLRNNRKLQDNIQTLTLQGRMQGIILSILPFLFGWWVLTFNRGYFNIMMSSEKGRFLLILAVVLQITGLYLIRRFSRIKI